MTLKKLIKKTFAYGNTSVSGLRGRGKDMLFANVIARRKQKYISNLNYKVIGIEHIPLDYSKLDTKNTYKNLLDDTIVPFDYEYPEKTDIYISDCGIYFPAQYCGELNRDYKSLPIFMALSRQLGLCNVHTNSQALNRVWDKLREQSDLYIVCKWCKVFFGKIVIQRIIIYDKYDSALKNVDPFKPVRAPMLAFGNTRAMYKVKNEELRRTFRERNGSVRSHWLVYWNKSNYDTRAFKKILKGEKEENEENLAKN